MIRFAVVLGACLLAAGSARAEPAIDGDTSCQAVVSYLNAHDSPHAHEAFLTVKRLMAELDKAAMARGLASALAPLNDRQAENVYIAAIEYCRDDPSQTLGRTSSDAYDGLREMLGPAAKRP